MSNEVVLSLHHPRGLLRSWLLVAACSAGPFGCGTAPPTEDAAAIVVSGHGEFLDAEGHRVEPSEGAFLAAQARLIAGLREDALAADIALSELPDETRGDPILDNAALIARWVELFDERSHPAERSLNNAIQVYYVQNFLPAHKRGPALATATRRSDALVTANAGAAYIAECRANGVPIPPPLFSPSWTTSTRTQPGMERGVFDGEFLDPAATAQLFYWESTTVPGLCMVLPRYAPSDPTLVKIAGMICYSPVTNKACFWDSPNRPPAGWRKGVQQPVENFKGGADLPANGGGDCTDCHAGENPFIVHSRKPAFDPVLSRFGSEWYEPIAPASFVLNPGPTRMLEAVDSAGRCDSCHQRGVSGGRFPQLSTRISGYCSLLNLALASEMPPYDEPALIATYTAHAEALKSACRVTLRPGRVVNFQLPPDSTVLSSPQLRAPLYACAKKVSVFGAILGSTLSLRVNGRTYPSVVVRTAAVEFIVDPLVVGDTVIATEVLGTSSASATLTVKDHRVDYPTGLPAPAIDPTLVYECANQIAVRNVPGAEITVLTNGAFPAVSGSSTDYTAIWPGKRPFVINDNFVAQQKLCTDVSPSSVPVKAVRFPGSLPSPKVSSDPFYTEQSLIDLSTLTNGARTSVVVGGTGAGTVSTPINWYPGHDVATPLGRRLRTGDSIALTENLCQAVASGSAGPAKDCSTAPAPRIDQPRAGTQAVTVTSAVPGARIRVFDETRREIGDGAGSDIQLSAILRVGQTLSVTQQLGSCFGSSAYEIAVAP